VEGVTVELDDQALGAPQAVALESAADDFHACVDLRAGEGGSVDQGKEALLELAPGGVLAEAAGGQDGAEARGPAATVVAVDQDGERRETLRWPTA